MLAGKGVIQAGEGITEADECTIRAEHNDDSSFDLF